MTRTEVYEKLTEIFQDVFDDDEITIEDSTTPKDIPEWDSLHQINLVMASEMEFDIETLPERMFALKNVGDFVDYVLELVNGVDSSSESTFVEV